MGNLFKMTEKEEKEYQRKAKQYARVKALIIFLLIGFSVVSGIIVVSNGFIFKWFGIENYRLGLDIFFAVMYILVMIGVLFFLYIIIASGIRVIIEWFRDRFSK